MAVVYILQMYKYFSLVNICRRQMLTTYLATTYIATTYSATT